MRRHTIGDRDTNLLTSVAQAIADGTPIDWRAAAGAMTRDATHRMETLRLIANVAAAFTAQREADDAATWRGTIDTAGSPRLASQAGDSRPGSEAGPVLFSWGNLRVHEHIGRGSFADVYRAFDPQLEREVALKLRRTDAGLDADARAHFVAEARKLARVQHPNVLVVHGVDVHAGRVGIWTELVHGKTLAQYVADNGPLGADEAARIGLDLCCALAALHGHDLVHRDLKPANVMRKSGGHIVLMDFGSAGDSHSRYASGERELCGTPLSTAPEVLLQGTSPQPNHDVYSLGVLLYWLVSGHYPVEASDFQGLLAKHTTGVHTPLVELRPELPLAFVAVVERALDPDPARRFASAGQMHIALADAIAARQPEPPQPRRRAVRLGTRLLSVGVAGVALGWVIWRGVGGLAAPLDVQARLYRDAAGTPQTLAEGSDVQPGDQLYLDIEANRRMYVWVIDEDAKGDVYALYPLDSDGVPPLSARRRYRLPGTVDGVEVNWQVSDVGGTETLLVIAATERIESVERTVASLPRPGEVVPAVDTTVGPDDAQVRGIGSVAPRRQAASRSGLIAQLMQGEGLRGGPRGVWMWRVTLKNEGQ